MGAPFIHSTKFLPYLYIFRLKSCRFYLFRISAFALRISTFSSCLRDCLRCFLLSSSFCFLQSKKGKHARNLEKHGTEDERRRTRYTFHTTSGNERGDSLIIFLYHLHHQHFFLSLLLAGVLQPADRPMAVVRIVGPGWTPLPGEPVQITEVRSLIKELGRNHTIILSTHLLPEVSMVCDRVIIIERGKQFLNCSVNPSAWDVFRSRTHETNLSFSSAMSGASCPSNTRCALLRQPFCPNQP